MRRALALAMANSPLARAHELDVERTRLDVQRFDGFWSLPQFTLNAQGGAVPEARGNPVFSPDSANAFSSFGPFVKLDIGFKIPLYGFGRISNAAAAARGALSAEEARLDQARNEIRLEVIKGYWGLAAAEAALEVAEDLRQSYEEILEQIEEKLADDAIDPNDAYEVQSSRYEIEKVYQEAFDGGRLVRRTIATFLGLADNALFTVVDEAPESALSADDVAGLVARAARVSPQLRALHAAVDALGSAMDQARSERWPLIVVGGGFRLAYAPNRDDQTNPFAFDSFNYRQGGAALGARWDLNFAKHDIEYTRRKIQRDATEARAQALQMKVELDVRAAYAKLARSRMLLDTVIETRLVSRRWLRAAADEFDLGIGEAEPLVKAYRQDYRLRAQVVAQEYEFRIALVELAFVLGDFDLYLTWVENGNATSS